MRVVASVPLLAVLLALPPTSPLVAQPATAEIDAVFADWDVAGSPGAAVAVVHDGQVVFRKGYGEAQLEYGIPIAPTTVFHVASVTKQFTAFGIALLEREGKLSVDDDIRTHLPELPDLGAPVTIRHLIHHTSGIRDQWELLAMAGWRLDDVITKDHILGMMRRQRELNFPPGSEYLYSNMGYTLLAEIVERVGGMPFPEWMAERVFEPLGMASTHMHDDHERIVPGRAYSYRPTEDGWEKAVLSYANAGATSLFTTAPDLARWLASLDSGRIGGPPLIDRVRERGVLTTGDTLDYAFAIVRDEHRGRTTWAHGGADAGFRSYVLHVPEERLGVAVLSNAASFPVSRAAHQVLDLFLPEPGAGAGERAGAGDAAGAQRAAETEPPEAQLEESPEVVVPPEVLERYEGRYAFDAFGLVEVRRVGEGLVVEASEQRYRLVALSDTTFAMPEARARVRFERADGEVTGMQLRGPGGDATGRRLTFEPLTGAELQTYTGVYYSPELETLYWLVVEGDELIARHVRHGELPLDQVDTDTFAGPRWFFGRVAFERDPAGRIVGFRLTGSRVRNLWFVRLEPGSLPGS
jgi:CubicO group peptidase (beta-lactamase class C family)